MNKCNELSLEYAGGKTSSFGQEKQKTLDDFKSDQVQNENIQEDGKKAEENTLAFIIIVITR